MDPIPLPAPYGGIDESVPTIVLESPYCQMMLNFNSAEGGVSLRNGDAKYKLISIGIEGFEIARLTTYGDQYAIAIAVDFLNNTNTRIYDVDTASLLTTVAYGQFYPFYFNNHLFIFNRGSVAGSTVYDGSSWGAVGYSGSGFAPVTGVVYKNRAYIIQDNAASYWYSDIEAISGALTSVSLTQIISNYSILAVIAPITLADNVATETLLAFVFESGEVLFYNGSYPDSATWALSGRANIGEPLNYQSGLTYQGDYLVFCKSGVVSLRDLFLKGSEAAQALSVNKRIQTTWRYLVSLFGNAAIGAAFRQFVHGVWDKANDRLIITFPYDSTTGAVGSTYFVYDTIRQSWYLHRSAIKDAADVHSYANIADIVFYRGKILVSSGMLTTLTQGSVMVWEKEGASGFTDRSYDDITDVPYDYEIISAAVKNGRTYVQKGEGLDVIVETDLGSQTDYYLIRDFGVDITLAQKVTTYPTTLQKPFVNTGIEGSFIQYKMSGTTTAGKTVGYKLWGTNFWIEQGKSPR